MSETNLKQYFVSERLIEEYERQQALFSIQPTIVQHFFEAQGRHIAESLVEGNKQVRFSLPDRISFPLKNDELPALVTIPQNLRNYTAGNLVSRLRKVELYKQLRHTLNELEQSPDRTLSVAASMLRHVTVLHMIYNMLPAGRSVFYKLANEEETIPSVPDVESYEPESAMTAETDAIVEGGKTEEGRGELLVPFVPYARKFYLPQWITFDENGDLLFKSVEEAQAQVKSMQRFMEVLFLAVALAPYISADEEYAKKRYGMLGQLVNQGRALATYQTKDIIARIKNRAKAGSLNRGLRIDLPYFDDQDLRVKESNIEIIPAGRIMFLPAFVVRTAQQEVVKVSQDTRYNPSTRRHLLQLLTLLEKAFLSK